MSFYGGQAILENNTIHNQYYGILYATKDFVNQNNTLHSNVYDTNYPTRSTGTSRSTSRDASADSGLPFVSIRFPLSNATIPSGNLTVQGTAFDEHSGVQKVELFEHTFPFNGQYPYELAMPLTKRNWATWQYNFNITEPGLHRILAKVTDHGGNENWNWKDTFFEITSPPSLTKTEKNPDGIYYGPRLAVVTPLFTGGAYNVGGFYEFYAKYDKGPQGKHVNKDLNLLTSKIPEYDTEARNGSLLFLTTHLQQISHTDVSNISDEDVHQGYIFNKDGSNAYDTLFVFHDEYATKESYSNLRQFVNNGGTVVFIDGNVLYAEVAYNPDMHTVTLVRGHGWKFNGSFAEKNVQERWSSENRDWIGSNFLWSHIAAPITFSNNPFNITHFEENYVSNPNATILLDYGAQIPEGVLKDNELRVPAKIATYELNYGKGKVIMLGLYGQNLVGNEAFLQFFDHIVLPRALGQPYRYGTLAGNDSVVYWWMNTGKVSKIERDTQTNALILTLERSEQKEDNLVLTLPHGLVEGTDLKIYNFSISVNGKKVNYSMIPDDMETGFKIPLTADATKVRFM